MIPVLRATRARVATFLQEARHLRDSEFPYPHAREALDAIIGRFEGHMKDLQSLSEANQKDVVKQRASIVLRDISNFVPLLGFVLRSTNVRNAFEVHGPLLRIARVLLGDGARLVLSSEWNYAPHTFVNIPSLDGFVFIGLPAPESANPLLIPLAGHELGHPLWKRNDLGSRLKHGLTGAISEGIVARAERVKKLYPTTAEDLLARVENLFTVEVIAPILELAARQSEERFCDFVGLRVFGTSYLSAFAYLLAPNWSGARPMRYPNLKRRANDLVAAAQRFEIDVDERYADLFEDLSMAGFTDEAKFQVELADEASATVVAQLHDAAERVTPAEKIPSRRRATEDEVLHRLRRIVPSDGSASLTEVLCAGWRAFEDERFWTDVREVKGREGAVLRDLLLKSCEVLEIEQLVQGAR
jgi:hypothetical protein